MKKEQATTPPKTEANHSLFYRGAEIYGPQTKTNCKGEQLRLLATGCYLKTYFEIKPVAVIATQPCCE